MKFSIPRLSGALLGLQKGRREREGGRGEEGEGRRERGGGRGEEGEGRRESGGKVGGKKEREGV